MSLSKFFDKVVELHAQYVTMDVKFRHLSAQFDRLLDKSEEFADKLIKQNDELNRRITNLEAKVDATLAASAKEALIYALREQFQDGDGTVPSTKQLLAHFSAGDQQAEDAGDLKPQKQLNPR